MASRIRSMITQIAAGLGVAVLLTVNSTHAQTARTASTRDLREQLESKLRPRSPEEFAFAERVVTMVEQGKLPLRTVRASFNWARNKRRPFRFPYFRRALQIEAAKLGIKL